MPINKTLLRKIRNQILRVPASYYQKSYGRPSQQAECGTACCIAGHALIQGGAALPHEVANNWRMKGGAVERIDFDYEAAKLLGLNKEQAKVLFAGGTHRVWPEPFGSAFDEADNEMDYRKCARIAADYINWIIKNGKVK